MTLFITVLGITAPVFILAAIGFGWVKMGYDYDIQFVTRLAMTISVPALIFTALIDVDMPARVLGNLVLASVMAYGVLTLVFWMLIVTFDLNRRVFLHALVFGNTGNLGLPLALFAFGDAGLGIAVIVFTVMALFSFTLGIWMVSDKVAFAQLIHEPVAWASVLGAVFMIANLSLPEWTMNTLRLLGQMAIPMMLVTLGVALARMETKRFGMSVFLSIAKIAICILVSINVAFYFGLRDMELAVLVLQISTPVAVTSYLLTTKYGRGAEEVAGLVVISTLASVIIIPLILAALL